ncbi:MAG: response regulator [Pirellulaceae bacterium]
MTQLVLDVGNCAPDHASIARMLQKKYSVRVLQADGLDDTLSILREEKISLILINRKLDMDYSDGTLILQALKADPGLRDIPVMLVTNYEEHQAAAVALGALPGFGKLSLDTPQTHERLSAVLS